MQGVCISGYISINFTISIFKYIVVLLILNALTALINLLLVLNFLNIFYHHISYHQNVVFSLFITLSIFLINSAASLGLSTFFANSSISLHLICLLIIDSRNFSKILLLLALYILLVSSGLGPIN